MDYERDLVVRTAGGLPVPAGERPEVMHTERAGRRWSGLILRMWAGRRKARLERDEQV